MKGESGDALVRVGNVTLAPYPTTISARLSPMRKNMPLAG